MYGKQMSEYIWHILHIFSLYPKNVTDKKKHIEINGFVYSIAVNGLWVVRECSKCCKALRSQDNCDVVLLWLPRTEDLTVPLNPQMGLFPEPIGDALSSTIYGHRALMCTFSTHDINKPVLHNRSIMEQCCSVRYRCTMDAVKASKCVFLLLYYKS